MLLLSHRVVGSEVVLDRRRVLVGNNYDLNVGVVLILLLAYQEDFGLLLCLIEFINKGEMG